MSSKNIVDYNKKLKKTKMSLIPGKIDYAEQRLEWVVENYETQVRFLFENLDFEKEGLEEVEKAYSKGKLVQAGLALSEYFLNKKHSGVLSNNFKDFNSDWYPLKNNGFIDFWQGSKNVYDGGPFNPFIRGEFIRRSLTTPKKFNTVMWHFFTQHHPQFRVPRTPVYAVQKLDNPLKGHIDFNIDVKIDKGQETRSAYLVFGDKKDSLIAVGFIVDDSKDTLMERDLLLVRGHRINAIEVDYLPVTINRKKVINLQVKVNLEDKNLVVKAFNKELLAKMTFNINEINYIGYSITTPNREAKTSLIKDQEINFSDILVNGKVYNNPLFFSLTDVYKTNFGCKLSYTDQKHDLHGFYGQITSNTWFQEYKLDQSFRNDLMANAFQNMKQEEEFSSATKILMLSYLLQSVIDVMDAHGVADIDSRNIFKRAHPINMITTALNFGILSFANNFPEFKIAKKAKQYVFNRVIELIKDAIYSDGASKELSMSYHFITANSLLNILDAADDSIENITELNTTIQKMIDFIIYTLNPDGTFILLGMGGKKENHVKLKDVPERFNLKYIAERFNRDDWLYIISNGEEGTNPKGLPSVVFPWGGQFIMRNSWEKDAHWAWFDIGPDGARRGFDQKLSLSISAYGRDLLTSPGTDPQRGGRTGRPGNWEYFMSRGHNTIMIDDFSQSLTGDFELKKPRQQGIDYFIEEKFDYAQASISNMWGWSNKNWQGDVTHTRGVLYLRDNYWVVIDHIKTDRPRKIEVNWGWYGDTKVKIQKKEIVSVNGYDEANLRITPISDIDWDLKIYIGDEEDNRGWYAGEYPQWWDKYRKGIGSPDTVYSTNIDTSTIFAWVMTPARGVVPKVKTELLSAPEGAIRLKVGEGNDNHEIAIRLIGDKEILLSNNLILAGKIAIINPQKSPIVVGGTIKDITGKLIAKS